MGVARKHRLGRFTRSAQGDGVRARLFAPGGAIVSRWAAEVIDSLRRRTVFEELTSIRGQGTQLLFTRTMILVQTLSLRFV